MKFVPTKISRTIGRKVLTTKKNSPHIFFAAGLVGIVTSTVLACKATLKLEKALDEIRDDFQDVNVLSHATQTETKPEVMDRDQVKVLSHVYTRSAIKVARLYAPSVIVGGVSIGALTGSHVQLTRRNTGLTLTLAAVTKAYDEYRVRVQNELGEAKELEIYRAIDEEAVVYDGKKELVRVTDPNGWSPYARFFDESSPNWQKDPEYNRIFIQCQQNYANHLLRSRGHVFLNEVYDSLGLERSRAGAVVGWVVDGEGDGYIDFGMFEATNARFINNLERSIILDFNVDGVVYDKI